MNTIKLNKKKGSLGSYEKMASFYMEKAAKNQVRYTYSNLNRMQEIFESCLEHGRLTTIMINKINKALRHIKVLKNIKAMD